MMLSTEQRRIALLALRGDQTLDDLAAAGAGTVAAIKEVVRTYLREKADLGPNAVQTRVGRNVDIVRDQRGVPHIAASDPYDLFFALGYAQAQDRLWQLDYLRRQARGRLSEIFGRATLENDILARTLGIPRLAERLVTKMAPDSHLAVSAFSDGINDWLARLPAGLPPEFEALGYEPEAWQPADSIAIQRRWWWYLTGRLHVIYTPAAVRAGVGDGALYDTFFLPDGAVAYIVPAGNYDPSNPWPGQPTASLTEYLGGVAEPIGSNNWAAAPAITRDGAALLASDPHVYYTVPADWYEVHLHGAGYDAIGAGYPAMPGILFGRNPRFGWAITNNICSQRDLYVERLNPDNSGEYQHDGMWTPLVVQTESIAIKDGSPHAHTTRYAHDRPIVDHLIPEGALPRRLWPETTAHTAISLAWVGFEQSDEIQSLLDLNRAETVAAGREALRMWRCPTWNMVLADHQGMIGYQCIGAIPLRGRAHRGYRFADDPRDTWQGAIPYDGLPRLHDPARGWVASANNPTAPPDFPYPLAGTWSPEDRAPRAEQLMATRQPHTLDTFAAMQTDVVSGRAERATPGLLRALGEPENGLVRAAVIQLRSWDYQLTRESVSAAIFYVFFWRWHQRVVRERFADDFIPLVQDSGWGLSSALLAEFPPVWFSSDEARISAIRESFAEAVAWLRDRFGADIATWQWGSLHRLGAVHPAAQTPLQHEMFDLPPRPHQGGAGTVANAFYAPPGAFDTRLGASYRVLADLGPRLKTRAISWPGQSGQPGSPHYADQVERYLADELAPVPFAWPEVAAAAVSRIQLSPE